MISRQGHSNYLQTLNNMCIQDYVDNSETAGTYVATPGSSHLTLLHIKTFAPVHAIRAYRGSRGLVPLSLKPRTTCGLTSHPDCLASRKYPHCRVNTRLGGPQRQWGYFGKQNNFLPLREFKDHSPWSSYCTLSYAVTDFFLQACGYITVIRIRGCQATTPHNTPQPHVNFTDFRTVGQSLTRLHLSLSTHNITGT